MTEDTTEEKNKRKGVGGHFKKKRHDNAVCLKASSYVAEVPHMLIELTNCEQQTKPVADTHIIDKREHNTMNHRRPNASGNQRLSQ